MIIKNGEMNVLTYSGLYVDIDVWCIILVNDKKFIVNTEERNTNFSYIYGEYNSYENARKAIDELKGKLITLTELDSKLF